MRSIASVPSYLVAAAAMAIVGAVLASALFSSLAPLSRQEFQAGRAVVYTVESFSDRVEIHLANTRQYTTAVDVFLVAGDGSIVTACPGSVYSSIDPATNTSGPGVLVSSGGIQLLGVYLRPLEVLKIVCYTSGLPGGRAAGVKVSERGAEALHGVARASIGSVPGAASVGGAMWGFGSPWYFSDLPYRIPITVHTTFPISSACAEVYINPSTVPSEVYNFLWSKISQASQGSNVYTAVVADPSGTKLATRADKWGNTLRVRFQVGTLSPGVYRFYLYFGDSPRTTWLTPDPSCSTTIPAGDPLNRHVFDSPAAYPGYVIPELRWTPGGSPGVSHYVLYTSDGNTFTTWVNGLRGNSQDRVRDILANAQPKEFPIGTPSTVGECRSWWWCWRGYDGVKTGYGGAPWGVAVYDRLPGVPRLMTNYYYYGRVASDDGVDVFLVTSRANYRVHGLLLRVYDDHGPNYWDYVFSGYLPRGQVEGSPEVYLIVLLQNGIYSGCCPGYLDFRFVAVYVEGQ